MQSLEDDALVLRIYPFAEADAVVVLLTRHHGKVRLMAKGLKKIRSRHSGIVSPFNLITVQFKPGQGDRLGILSGATLQFGVDIARGSLHDYYFLSLMTEVGMVLEIDPMTGERVFRLLDAMVRCVVGSGFREILLWYFLFWIARLEGELADPSACGICGRPFNTNRMALGLNRITLAFHCRSCTTPSSPDEMGGDYREVQRAFQRFLSTAPDQLPTVRSVPEAYEAITRLLMARIEQLSGRAIRSLSPLLAVLLQRPEAKNGNPQFLTEDVENS